MLNATNLKDRKDRVAAVLAQVQSVDQQIAKIEEEAPALCILGAWTAYRDAPNRPDSGERTLQGYDSQFGRFVEWMAATHPNIRELRQVTEEMAYQFAAELGRSQSPNTYNKYLVLLRRMWKVLAKPARLTCNPWDGLDPKLLATHSRRELTVDELTRVCAAVDGDLRMLFALGLYSGLRLGDAVQVKWSNVDLMRRVLTVIPSKTARRSNGKMLRIPMHRTLHAMLDLTPQGGRTGYVMPKLAELYQRDDTAVAKCIRAVFEGCGIVTRCKVEGYSRAGVDVGFHSLRHSFVSLSANAGASLASVQAIVGHSNPAMTRHYLHADQNVVQAAVDSLPDVTGAPRITSAAANPREGDVGAALALLERLDVPGLKVVAARARKLITTRK